MLLLLPGSALLTGPLDLTAQLRSSQNALLPDCTITDSAPRGIGSRLSPVHFGGLRPRRVSCYAFFEGWLLLSLPPRCLRTETLF